MADDLMPLEGLPPPVLLHAEQVCRRFEGGVLTLRVPSGAVSCVAFSPDGRRLVSGGPLSHVTVWDAVTGQEVFTVRGPLAVDSVTFSRDGRRLAAAGRALVKVWDATTGQELLTLPGHGREVLDVTFSPDGRSLASANDDGTVRVWNANPLPDVHPGGAEAEAEATAPAAPP